MVFYKSPWLVWSNVFWLIPTYIAVSAGSFVLAAPSVIVMMLSMWFHWRPSILTERIDTIFSMLYIAIGPVLCTLAPNPYQAWMTGVLVTIFAFYWWLRARAADRCGDQAMYIRMHGFGWHPAAAGVTTTIYVHYFGLL